jgi:hypothetical protein
MICRLQNGTSFTPPLFWTPTQRPGSLAISGFGTFWKGAATFRNARQWAQEQRNAFISAANKKARPVNPEPSQSGPSEYSDVSEHEELLNASHLTQTDKTEGDYQHGMSQRAATSDERRHV